MDPDELLAPARLQQLLPGMLATAARFLRVLAGGDERAAAELLLEDTFRTLPPGQAVQGCLLTLGLDAEACRLLTGAREVDLAVYEGAVGGLLTFTTNDGRLVRLDVRHEMGRWRVSPKGALGLRARLRIAAQRRRRFSLQVPDVRDGSGDVELVGQQGVDE